MALDKTSLKSALLALMTKTTSSTADAAAQELADTIEAYVKSAICNGSVSVSLAAVTSSPTGGPLIGAASATFTGSGLS